MELGSPPLRDGVASTATLARFDEATPALAMHALALSGESDGHSRGAEGQPSAVTANVNPTSSSSRSSPRVEGRDTSSAAAFFVTPATAVGTPEIPTLEELLDGPAGCCSSSSAVRVQLPIANFAPAAHEGTDERAGEATAAAVRRPKEATAPADLTSVSSLSREARSSVRAGSLPPRGSAAAVPAQPPIPSAAVASSRAPLPALTTTPAGPLVVAVTDTATSPSYQEPTLPHVHATAGNVADVSPIAQRPPAKGEGPRRRCTRTASRTASCSARQSAGRGRSSSAAIPPMRTSKSGGATTAYAAALLRGILGADTPADRAATCANKKGTLLTALPSLTTLDLPVGLLVLYCAAEEMCATRKEAAALATSSTEDASAHSLLYILEQLSDLRRHDHRRAALRKASEAGRAKCEELYEAACKKRELDAAHRATRAQAVVQEELGACTFRPAVSRMVLCREAKGAKNFMQRCVEWKAEVDRRLRRRCEQLAEMETEQWAAAAAHSGISTPGEAITERSRRLLAQRSVQERLKSRPLLWEAKRPNEDSQAREEGSSAPSHALAEPAASPLQLLGMPLTSTIVEEQEAVLRGLRRPCSETRPSGEPSLLPQPQNTSAARVTKSFRGTVKRFLSRVEQDAEQREQNAAKLQARYHDPEAERFECATGRPLFRPNAMPTAMKDGHRVSFDHLPREKQEELRAELRRAGLEFMLSHYLRERQRERQESAAGSARTSSVPRRGDDADATEGSAPPQRSTSLQPHGRAMAEHHARFMASLEAALARKEQNWERLRAQATVEETFHPQITKRSARMALHKTGGTPVYERLVKSKEGMNASGARPVKTEPQLSSSARKDQPLPEAVQLFLARNGQWVDSRQRRLQHLAELEEERLRAGCTFTPSRHYDNVYGVAEPLSGVEESLMSASLHTGSPMAPYAAAGDSGDYREASQSHVRLQDLMASAADVRVMNELELLRSGAAFRDEQFVQSVCEQSGLTDTKRAMANLSLHSAPRLIRGGKGARAASSLPLQSSEMLSQSHLSPIPQRSNRPSASPCLLLRRDTRAPSLPFCESALMAVPAHLQSGSTPTPPIRRTATGAAEGARSGAFDFASDSPPAEDPWAALDAQIDAILKRHGHKRRRAKREGVHDVFGGLSS
ncbi:hypothetical protein LSCM1_01935 [Leishmania martiniquensis]|uniref:Uncharacterized protein n=1 Tax=Leishmania martiniquensis TaxID=1580590 RepID=A0A836KBW3_9TRYP|nr:hypothetical protein LSCM1_01935 [Leishmania martiniquensis]